MAHVNLTPKTTQVISDEDFARRLQSQSDLSDPYECFDHPKRPRAFRRELRRHAPITTRIENTNEDENSVIIIDDDDDQDRLVSTTLNQSDKINLEKQKELEEMLKLDEMVARKLQEELDKEFAESLRAVNLSSIRRRQHMRLPANLSPIASETDTNQETIRPYRPHSDSLEEALRQINRRSSRTQSNHHHHHHQSTSSIHPSIEQDMLNLLARNISSNELHSSNDDQIIGNPAPLDRINTLNFERHRSLNRNNNSNTSTANLNGVNNSINRLDLLLSNSRYNAANHRSDSQSHANNMRHMRLNEPEIYAQTRRRNHNHELGSFRFSQILNSSYNNYENLLQLEERNVKTKISKDEFESLSTFQFKTIQNNVSESDTTCSICFDDYKNTSRVTSLVCSHKFHTECIKKWLNQNRRCPLCQKDAINGE